MLLSKCGSNATTYVCGISEGGGAQPVIPLIDMGRGVTSAPRERDAPSPFPPPLNHATDNIPTI